MSYRQQTLPEREGRIARELIDALVDATDNTGGTASGTNQIANLADGTTYANDHAAIENNFATIAAMLNTIQAALRAV